MSESKLRELSMEFSVDIIELVKYLKSIKESISPIRLAEAEQVLVQIYTRLNMHKERRTLFPNSKLP